MKRIVILVNKDFEYAGFIEGLRDTVSHVYAGTNGRQAECRFDDLIADIYCIQNLFKPEENSSNSEVKYEYLKDVLFKSNAFRIDELDAVLSVSTSESTPISQGHDANASKNGCVYVGNKFFMSDRRENDKTTQSHLDIGSKDCPVEFYDIKQKFGGLYESLSNKRMLFKQTPLSPDFNPRCYASDDFISVGVVNVMDYSCYKEADKVAYEKSFIETVGNPIGIETTHGVVVKALNGACKDLNRDNIPVTFISPIVDRYLRFDDDVDGKYGKQNFVSSYNGGVATGHILKALS